MLTVYIGTSNRTTYKITALLSLQSGKLQRAGNWILYWNSFFSVKHESLIWI